MTPSTRKLLNLSAKDMSSQSVKQALGPALRDGKLSDREVIDILVASLDGNAVTRQEREDLRRIAQKSTSLSERSRRLISHFSNSMLQPSASLTTGRPRVIKPHTYEKVLKFMQRSGPGQFTKLNRLNVGLGLLARLKQPSKIDQAMSSLCGPAAFVYSLAWQKPDAYVDFATNLFENGKASVQIGEKALKIKPSKDCRKSSPEKYEMEHVDWLTLASIRDAMNKIFDMDDSGFFSSIGKLFGGDFRGITMPRELAKWFNRAGFTDVVEKGSAINSGEYDRLVAANQAFKKGHMVCLFINAKVLGSNEKKRKKGSMLANHWVVLSSEISGLQKDSKNVKLDVFTWGYGKWPVPQTGQLTMDQFLKNFYGYVSAKAF